MASRAIPPIPPAARLARPLVAPTAVLLLLTVAPDGSTDGARASTAARSVTAIDPRTGTGDSIAGPPGEHLLAPTHRWWPWRRGGPRAVVSVPTTVAPEASPAEAPPPPANASEEASRPAEPPPADPVAARCAAALADVEATGLRLPARFQYRCPGDTRMSAGDRQHWGVACAANPFCPDAAYIAINPDAIGPSEARMRYVVAHETCHAVDYVSGRAQSEAAADACAAAHGFPRV